MKNLFVILMVVFASFSVSAQSSNAAQGQAQKEKLKKQQKWIKHKLSRLKT